MSKILDSQDGWKNPNSYIVQELTSDGLHIFSGSFFFRGIEYRFKIRQQKTGPSFLRGHVSPISPADGRILQVSGQEKKARLANVLEEDLSSGKHRLSKLNIHAEIYPKTLDISDIKGHIEKAVMKLYGKHAAYLHRIQGEIARPDTITPGVAAHKHIDRYLAVNHPNLSAKSCTEYRRTIVSACVALPAIPMSQYRASTIKDFFDANHLSDQTQDRVRKFWEFCLDAKICEGKLPFPPKVKKTPSIDRALRNALRPDTLSLKEEDKLFEVLMANPSGPSCGVALQLWGGYSAKISCGFTWGDIIWSNDKTYVRAQYFRPDAAGATHNYTAPLFIAGALILLARYNQLRKSFTEHQLSEMPIVSQVRNPKLPMVANALTQHSTTMLYSIGLSYANIEALRQTDSSTAISKRILLNTYAHSVNVRCSLQSEPGTAAFLLHQSLSRNVTDDHYTTFSDEEAGRHLHALMSAVQPLRPIADQSSCIQLEDGREKRQIYPETTRQRVGYVGKLILQPGEEIVVEVPHGFIGSVRTRAINNDGTLKRKNTKRTLIKPTPNES